jgi:hypothetical protein
MKSRKGQIIGPCSTSFAVSLFAVNLLKLFINFNARSVAATCHLEGVSHDLEGSRILSSTPSTLVGILKLKTGRVINSQLPIESLRMALIICLVD